MDDSVLELIFNDADFQKRPIVSGSDEDHELVGALILKQVDMIAQRMENIVSGKAMFPRRLPDSWSRAASHGSFDVL
ncbi:hypothetical protein [Nesterenkonia sp.]|uniref:hypothetical protein n=1 Tax=Nesterenkonia sp. TaxID=704201 RepID=UPI002601BFA4|nr:hypothetical protein [Nesterenkonia sp.]